MSDYVTKTNILDALDRFNDNTMARESSTYATKAELATEQARLTKAEKQIENLNSKAGDYTETRYQNAPSGVVPTGKAKYAEASVLRGVSRGWNQLADPTSGTSNDITFTVSDGNITYSGTSSSLSFSFFPGLNSYATSLVVGHKYIVLAYGDTTYIQLREYNTSSSYTVKNLNEILTVGSNFSYLQIRLNGILNVALSGTVTIQTVDLTLMYGSGNEPSTPEEVLQRCPQLGQYNSYDAGSLVSNTISGVTSKSRNVFDGTWEDGYLNSANGTVNYSTEYATTGYIPVLPSTLFHVKGTQTSLDYVNVAYYDSDKVFVKYYGSVFEGLNASFTTRANVFYMRITITKASTSKDGLCVNVSDSQNGTYTPYWTPKTLSLPSPVELRSAGSVQDTLEPNVEVNGVAKRRDTQNIQEIDLGDYTWTKRAMTGKDAFYTPISSLPSSPKYETESIPNITCGIFETTYQSASFWPIGSIVLTIYAGILPSNSLGCIVEQGKYADGSAFKSAMSGVKVNYEMTTPVVTLSDPLTDNLIYTESGGTLTPVQTNDPEIDTDFSMGFLAL